MNKTMVCLYLAFGLMGCSAKPATLYIVTNGYLEQKDSTYTTLEECRLEGIRLESLGKIRDYHCAH